MTYLINYFLVLIRKGCPLNKGRGTPEERGRSSLNVTRIKKGEKIIRIFALYRSTIFGILGYTVFGHGRLDNRLRYPLVVEEA